MNSIIFLVVILAIYYYVYQNYYDRVEEKYHYYFYGSIGVYLVILYIYHFEYEFFYRLLKNVYDTNQQPLYTFNSMNSNAELFESQHANFNIKETLLQKQSGRCYACSNFIMNNDLHHTKLKYKNPLQNGGQNNVENIGLVCSQCFGFQ
jgi:hypothetical protein